MRPCLNQPNKTDGQKEREMGKREGNRIEGGREGGADGHTDL